MIPTPPADRVRSIRQRLRDGARARNEDFQYVLDRFAVERMLYRLSQSPYQQQFLLKGAMLFAIWFDVPHRPTRDADFLGYGRTDPAHLTRIVHDLCAMELDDGLHFDAASTVIDPIREGSTYQGLRMRLQARLGNALCHVQWDVGFGDAVLQAPPECEYPVLLDEFPPPRLRVYPREAVFAEKLEAIAALGIANSRMKDYFDLLALAREGQMARPALVATISATFERRGTRWTQPVPFGLSEEFADDPHKQAQWTAFLRRNRLHAESLDAVVKEISAFVRALNG
ncbi:nucleotidyl transferase AbiEii/AbiGii toxin family protein [Stenotrophomonas sp. PFBMAA-4]|uniref:nucleotidyl transferase AbiEii/AbiGii toxin family protein n=1 Tax=Stenotrophomonas sp. PFBMAA-4 TaxID=3043301 RepID=UPI0024B590C6|nr:nucleotidyl transferase AbiEii/AbiGii toxin family protein [Stenotrophomonas sp. PFBMAA-4]MDI9272876.1 nucleotidyl transferase AbiEii/AbiGii toxin family protein [Stenotrophomonas sp. PFBMAA-4]